MARFYNGAFEVYDIANSALTTTAPLGAVGPACRPPSGSGGLSGQHDNPRSKQS
jgi:hypothetical protein